MLGEHEEGVFKLSNRFVFEPQPSQTFGTFMEVWAALGSESQQKRICTIVTLLLAHLPHSTRGHV